MLKKDDGDDYGWEEPRRSRRGDYAPPATSSRLPVIPGERKSARLTAKENEDVNSYTEGTNGAGRSSVGTGSRPVSPVKVTAKGEDEEEGDEDVSARKRRKVDDEDEDDGDEWEPNGNGPNGNVEVESGSEFDGEAAIEVDP